MTLAAVARVLGGEIVDDMLETNIGSLSALVIRRVRPPTTVELFDLVVFGPDTPFDRNVVPPPLHVLEIDEGLPRLGNGYLFVANFNGTLFATPFRAVTIGEIVETLWKLASLARQDWTAKLPRPKRWRDGERYSEAVARWLFVIAVTLLVFWLRR